MDLSPRLLAAIEEFAAIYPECLDGDYVRFLCADYSRLFADLCHDRGIACWTVWFEEDSQDEGEYDDDSGTWVSGYRNHCVVLVENIMVDWTYRQFDPDAAVPSFWTEPPWGKMLTQATLING